jgi:signal transduction histidine kinase
MKPEQNRDEIISLLGQHKKVCGIPRAEIEWLAANGIYETHPTGEFVLRHGDQARGMYIIFKGRIAFRMDRGGGTRVMLEWGAGEISGQLPYSRMVGSPGDTSTEEPTTLLMITRDLLPALPAACPELAAICVHEMLDRARQFRSWDLHDEKMLSLGKLASGLAHELNNPASAAARSAKLLAKEVFVAEEAARVLGAAGLSADQVAQLEAFRAACAIDPAGPVRSPLERADREEELGDWFDAHGVAGVPADELANSNLSIDALERLAAVLPVTALTAAVRWMATGCSVQLLAHEIESATTRIHHLVDAVKEFTFMDREAIAENIDVVKGLENTITVLESKAHAKNVSVILEGAPGLPGVHGFGSEINQIWEHLLDNAIDAVPRGGCVRITVTHEKEMLSVRITDNGPGIPSAIRDRIFDPFFTTKPVGQGTGLGLDIVNRLVRWHHGEMTMTSEPGCTVFRVNLPAAK